LTWLLSNQVTQKLFLFPDMTGWCNGYRTSLINRWSWVKSRLCLSFLGKKCDFGCVKNYIFISRWACYLHWEVKALGRVTRWVCEKINQNVAQQFFVKTYNK
jgi:hypothetical protein